MTNQELRTAYYTALLALFKTNPGTPDNLQASEECGRLYDMNPDLCGDVDDSLGDDRRMNGGAA